MRAHQVGMPVDGELTVPLDILDLLLHASPWLLLALRIGAELAGGADEPGRG